MRRQTQGQTENGAAGGGKLFAYAIGRGHIGWAVFDLAGGTAANILKLGVYTFPDGQNVKKTGSLKKERSDARRARVWRGRRRQRLRQLYACLTGAGLAEGKYAFRDEYGRETAIGRRIYSIWARAAREKVAAQDLGAVFMLLAKRRGFQSNRLADAAEEKDIGKVAAGISALRARLKEGGEGGRPLTCGEFFYNEIKAGRPARLLANSAAMTGETAAPYAFYIERDLIKEDFDKIWETQARFHPQLTKELKKEIEEALLFQRPLKAPDLGHCAYFPEEPRLRKSDPLFQQLRLVQEINNLRVVNAGESSGRALRPEERDALIALLSGKKTCAFRTMAKKIGLTNNEYFNFEEGDRTGFDGDLTGAVLGGKKLFGAEWRKMSLEKQREAVSKLETEPEKTALESWLAAEFPALSPEARALISAARLPAGTGRLGESAAKAALREMRAPDRVLSFRAALKAAGLETPISENDLPQLPRYQELAAFAGEIRGGTGNPQDSYEQRMGAASSVYTDILLNRLRVLTNTLIESFGKPAVIRAWIDRELELSVKARRDQFLSKKTEEKLVLTALEACERQKAEPSQTNILKYKLWSLLPDNAECSIYSGRAIPLTKLFTPEVKIDYILPYAATLDGSRWNRTLCFAEELEEKGGRAPSDVPAWQQGDNYEQILARAQKLPPEMRWRFSRDAIERFENPEYLPGRLLENKKYLAQMLRAYFSVLFPPRIPLSRGGGGAPARQSPALAPVSIISERLAIMMLRCWRKENLLGGMEKNSGDLRIHAVSAAAAGIADWDFLDRLRQAAAEQGAKPLSARRALGEFLGNDFFVARFKNLLQKLRVKAREQNPAPAAAGRLHKETCYGKTALPDKAVIRKMIADLRPQDIDSICNDGDRAYIRRFISERREAGQSFAEAIAALARGGREGGKRGKGSARFAGMRHIRVLVPVKTDIEFRQKADGENKSQFLLRAGSNYCCDIWQTEDGKWHGEVISRFQAAQPRNSCHSPFKRKHPHAKKIMRLHKGDYVCYEEDGTVKTVLARVVKIGANGQLAFAPHNVAGAAARNVDPNDDFRYMLKSAAKTKQLRLRRVRITNIGEVFDGGFRG